MINEREGVGGNLVTNFSCPRYYTRLISRPMITKTEKRFCPRNIRKDKAMTANYGGETINWPTRGLWAFLPPPPLPPRISSYRALCATAESLTRFELAGFNKIPTAKRGKVCERYEFYVNLKFDRTGKGTTFIAGIKKKEEREREKERRKKEKKIIWRKGAIRKDWWQVDPAGVKGIPMSTKSVAQREIEGK